MSHPLHSPLILPPDEEFKLNNRWKAYLIMHAVLSPQFVDCVIRFDRCAEREKAQRINQTFTIEELNAVQLDAYITSTTHGQELASNILNTQTKIFTQKNQ